MFRVYGAQWWDKWMMNRKDVASSRHSSGHCQAFLLSEILNSSEEISTCDKGRVHVLNDMRMKLHPNLICVNNLLLFNYLKYMCVCSLCVGARGSIVGWGTMLQTGRSRVRFSMRSLDFSFHLILSATLCPGINSASNRNKYQESPLG
jgi:hypothetical protein